jgi:hypothetical protein
MEELIENVVAVGIIAVLAWFTAVAIVELM